MADKVVGFNSEDDFRRMARVVRRVEYEPRSEQTSRARWPASANDFEIRWGVALSDWTAFGALTVQICTGPKSLPVPTDDDPVDCEGPGIEGTKCTIGLVVPVTGLDGDVEYNFLPLECEPSLDTDSSGNCVLGTP